MRFQKISFKKQKTAASLTMLTKKDAYPELTPKSGIVGQGSWKKLEIGKFQVGKSEVRKFLFKLESFF